MVRQILMPLPFSMLRARRLTYAAYDYDISYYYAPPLHCCLLPLCHFRRFSLRYDYYCCLRDACCDYAAEFRCLLPPPCCHMPLRYASAAASMLIAAMPIVYVFFFFSRRCLAAAISPLRQRADAAASLIAYAMPLPLCRYEMLPLSLLPRHYFRHCLPALPPLLVFAFSAAFLLPYC